MNRPLTSTDLEAAWGQEQPSKLQMIPCPICNDLGFYPIFDMDGEQRYSIDCPDCGGARVEDVEAEVCKDVRDGKTESVKPTEYPLCETETETHGGRRSISTHLTAS